MFRDAERRKAFWGHWFFFVGISWRLDLIEFISRHVPQQSTQWIVEIFQSIKCQRYCLANLSPTLKRRSSFLLHLKALLMAYNHGKESIAIDQREVQLKIHNYFAPRSIFKPFLAALAFCVANRKKWNSRQGNFLGKSNWKPRKCFQINISARHLQRVRSLKVLNWRFQINYLEAESIDQLVLADATVCGLFTKR